MDETDDFIDDTDTQEQPECQRLQPQQWNGFGDGVAQRFLRLRGITTEALQESTLERHAGRKATHRLTPTFTVPARPALVSPGAGARVPSMSIGFMRAAFAAR